MTEAPKVENPLQTLTLTGSEQFALSCAMNAVTGAFDVEGPVEERTLRASVVRRILLQMPLKWTDNADDAIYPIPSTGLRLSNAVLVGSLNLRNGRASNAAMPALALNDCFIKEALVLDHAWINELDLSGSRLTTLSAHGVRIDGPVNISRVRSAENPDAFTGSAPVGLPGEDTRGPQEGLCWIDLTHANIGELVGVDTRLCAPHGQVSALVLDGAIVRGSIALTPGLFSIGGLSFDRAEIAGNIDLDGALIPNPRGRSVSAQGTIVGAFVNLRALAESAEKSTAFFAAGDVDFYRARIDGGLEIFGFNTSGKLSVRSIEVRGWFLIGPWTNPFDSAATSYHVRIAQQLQFQGGKCGFLEIWDTRLESGADFKDFTADAMRLNLRAPVEGGGGSRPVLNFNDVTVRSLEDEQGKSIPDGYLLSLDGLRYSSMDADRYDDKGKLMRSSENAFDRKNVATDRLRWLALQYTDGVATRINFRPGPYDLLAKHLRTEGRFEAARAITRRRIELERKVQTHWSLRPFLWLYNVFFDSGLSPETALRTFIGCLLAGWVFVSIADHGLNARPGPDGFRPFVAGVPKLDPVLVVQTTSVNSVVTISHQMHRPVLGAPIQSEKAASLNEVPCEEHIEPMLYAIDLFVPALDLQQREKCEINTTPAGIGWRIGSAAYTVLGWIVTSLTFLTISGILRRQAEA